MTAPFDPYHRWLGIRPEEQPADHYRLLGLARFEDDIEVIRDAAERQMGHVRRYAGGEHADDAKRILNELGSAKACLIVEDKRRSYDATLQAGMVVERDANHAAKNPGIDVLASSDSAPILVEIIEPNLSVVASTPDVDDPLQFAPQPETSTFSTAPTPARRRPKTLAQMQSLRQPQRPKASSDRLGVRQVDDFLKRIAGDDNALLYGFLRVFAVAVAIIIPAVCILAAGSWAMHWSSDARETSDRSIATVPSPNPMPLTTAPAPPLATTTTVTPPPPTPLVLAPVDDAEVDEEQELRLEFALADAGSVSDSVRFEFVGASHGATLDPRGVITWTPTEAQGSGEFPFLVRAVASSDAAQPRVSETLGFKVVVLETNQPPQFEPTDAQQVTVGDELTLTLRATDPDLPANVLTFIPLKKPANSDLNSARGDFRWTPSDSSVTGEYVDLVIEVRDNGIPPQSVQQTIRIRVRPKPAAQITNSIGMKLNLIPAGEFMMGSPPTEAGRADDEHQHPVRITQPFYMATTEVTQGQWSALMGTEPWNRPTEALEGEDVAATFVSWLDAQEFCRKLSIKDGGNYRLPTEAEWEYSCRAGSMTAYSFGDSATSLKDYAWFHENAWNVNEKYAHRVGQKLANEFGLFDMHGNVAEWCADWHDENYYATLDASNPDPAGPAMGSFRSFRGGSLHYAPQNCRSAFRTGYKPANRYFFVGIRVYKSVK